MQPASTRWRRLRLDTGLRWLLQPWRSLGLAVALVASFAVPAFMAATADVFRTTAADEITDDVLAERPGALDVAVLATGPLTEDGVAALEEVIPERLQAFDHLGTPARTVYVPGSADLGLERPAVDPDLGNEPIIGSAARVMAREGAIEALEVVDGDTTVPGLWISERMAERTGLAVGAAVAVGGSDPVILAGIFRDLWDGDRDPFWDDVPAELVPRFSRTLSGPLFEVVVVDEEVLYTLGLAGIARWDAVVGDPPGTRDDLAAHVADVTALERAFTGSPPIVEALDAFSGPGRAVPVVSTEAGEVLDDVDGIIAELDQPISTAALGGIVLGLIITAVGAAFAVRKRATEFRLLRADGDAPWRFGARALVQYLAPAVLGGLLGLLAAHALAALSADGSGRRTGVIDHGSIALVVLVGLGVAAAVTAFASTRVLDRAGRGSGPAGVVWLLPIIGLAVAAWIQVGADDRRADVDPLVVAFPLLGLVAGVGALVFMAHWAIGRARTTGAHLPAPVFLAWRRIASAEGGALVLSTAMGVALGLIVFATTLVASLEASADAKAITVIGGRTQARVQGPLDTGLPDQSTLVLARSRPSTVGDLSVHVVAIDPADYAEGVSWHPLFGGSPDAVIEALSRPVGADLAAVRVGELELPDAAGFGTSEVLTYEVVDALAGAPLASAVFPTIIIDADQAEEVARRTHAGRRPNGVEPGDWDDQFRSPFATARRLVVSQLDAAAIIDHFDGTDTEIQEIVTLADERDEISNRAAQWTFRYIGLLAAVAGLAALGTLLFYLSERRAVRELSTVMAARMGLRRSGAALAAVIELLGLVVVSFAAATATGVLIAQRVFDRFEPDPRVPPSVALDVPWGLVTVIGVGALVIAAAAAIVTQQAADRRSYAEVLRGT